MDFAALFSRSHQDPEDPEHPDELERPTARQAALLHACLGLMSDEVGFDIERYRGVAVTFDNREEWWRLSGLPIATWRQKSAWRRRFRACIDDLISDLEAGDAPIPRCVGEEVALRLAIEEALHRDAEEIRVWEIDKLPADPVDGDWDNVVQTLFQDVDVEEVLWPDEHEGIWETPEAIALFRPADYRPAAWFEWFLNVEPRPGRGDR
jgi:hypothetical protein